MANSNFCNICPKKNQQHDCTLRCCTCSTAIHTKCLPTYLDSDYDYASDTRNHWSCTRCLKTLFPFYDTEVCNFQFINDINNSTFDIDELNKMIYNPLGSQWDEEEGRGVE